MLFKFFKIFLLLGFFSFGGGYSMISLIEREIVDRYEILKKKEFDEAVSIAGSLPGAIGINMAIFIGNSVAGTKGAMLGVLATSIPCMTIIFTVFTLFSNMTDNILVKKALLGMSGVIVAFILYASYKIALSAYKNKKYFLFTIFTFIISLFFKWIPVPLIIFLSIVTGILISKIERSRNVSKTIFNIF